MKMLEDEDYNIGVKTFCNDYSIGKDKEMIILD